MTDSGWRCPTCGRCYAPFMMQCTHCPAPLLQSANTIDLCENKTVTPEQQEKDRKEREKDGR